MADVELTADVGFNDVVRLANDEVGTVRFIGFTEFKKNIVFYGLNLKEANGKHNGSLNKISYFKCPKSHGVFTEKRNIIEIIQRPSVSARFHHDQNVLLSELGLKGKLLYVGLTKFDNYQNYMYGVKLSKNLTDADREGKIKDNAHMFVLQDHEMNTYFDANAKRSIFVRQNQLKSLENTPSSSEKEKKSKKKKKKSAGQNKENYLKTRQQQNGSANRRSLSMQPSKRSKPKSKAKGDGASNSSSNLKEKAQSPKSNASPSSSSSSKKKKSKPKEKEKEKKKRVRPPRNAVMSDLGAISKSKKSSSSKKGGNNTARKSAKANKKTNPSKLRITKSTETVVDFDGCQTPIKPDKSSDSKKKKKKKRTHKPTHSRANSTSYMIDEVKQQKQANLTVTPKTSKTKKSNKKKGGGANKSKKSKDVQPRKRSNTSNGKKPTKESKNNKKKKKKAKEAQQSRDDMAIIDEDAEDDDEELSYRDILNDKEKFMKYIDSKNYYYHQQFIDEEKTTDDNQVVLSRVKERAPPPPMVSFFSSKSRVNQRKKRALPEAPNTYTITISSRPLGFFIETRKLNTFVEDTQSGEHKREQVEIVEGKNKFNKVNAYVSSIASEQWHSVVMIGSQLLSINDDDITGKSFAKIFQQLSEQPLPFTLKLAAPRTDIPALRTMISAETVGQDLGASSPPTSPNAGDDDAPPPWTGISDMPRGRGQTIDESKFKKKKKFILF